jgi:hypothetical protein
MQDKLQVLQWNNKLRLTINTNKTEATCFTKKGNTTVNISVNGKQLPHVETNICIGVTLDQHLTFVDHASTVARKAMGALTKISAQMADVGGIQIEIGTSDHIWSLRTQSGAVRPTSKCASWRGCTELALLRATGTVNSTPASVIEVLALVPPLKLRYQEILSQEFIRHCRKPHDNPLRGKMLQCLEDRVLMDHRVLPPAPAPHQNGNQHSIHRI